MSKAVDVVTATNSAAAPVVKLHTTAMSGSNVTMLQLGEIADDVKSMADYRIFPVLLESMLFCGYYSYISDDIIKSHAIRHSVIHGTHGIPLFKILVCL